METTALYSTCCGKEEEKGVTFVAISCSLHRSRQCKWQMLRGTSAEYEVVCTH